MKKVKTDRNYIGQETDEYGNVTYEYENIGESGGGYTSESPEEYNERWIRYHIEQDANKITIKFEGKDYNTEQLKELYYDIPEPTYGKTQWEIDLDKLADTYNKQEVSQAELDSIKEIKAKHDSKRWKTRMRSLRRKGKLEQYKIDLLNKHGMIWHPKGSSIRSFDEWEDKYLSLKAYGMCYEIKDWIEKQRLDYKNNNLSDENLFRLQAVNFQFKSQPNEKYKLTRRSCWTLREKLEKKVKRFILSEQKKYDYWPKEHKYTPTKKDIERQKEANAWYERKSRYCSPTILNEMDKEEAFKILSNIDKGISFEDTRLKEFLDIEREKDKKNKKTGSYDGYQHWYDSINYAKLDNEKIYSQLSKFNKNYIHTHIRKQACHYMLKYIPDINMKSAQPFFREINYLISIYKKEKNKTELIYLKEFIEKYPILNELYGEKINTTIVKLKP